MKNVISDTLTIKALVAKFIESILWYFRELGYGSYQHLGSERAQDEMEEYVTIKDE